MKVLLLENIHHFAKEKFEKVGFEVDTKIEALNGEELNKELKNYDIIGIKSKTRLNSQILEENKHLKVVGVFAAGFDNVDIKKADELGIVVFNAPFSNTRAVVEGVIGEMIMIMRQTFVKANRLKNGYWDKTWQNSYQIENKTLGIFGYGNIGSKVGILAEKLGMNVVFYDFFDKEPIGEAIKCETLEELIEKSDVISLHCFALDKPVFEKKHIQKMKKGAILMNFARGNVLDYTALVEALESKNLGGAGIDVFPEEPESNILDFKHDLQKFENVILTPHTGGSTLEAQEDMAKYIPAKIIKFLKDGDQTGALKPRN